MKRRIWNVVCLVFALGGVGMMGAWGWSWKVGRLACWSGERRTIHVGAFRGEVWVYLAREPGNARGERGLEVGSYPTAWEARRWGYGPAFIPFHFDFAGFGCGWGAYTTVPGRRAAVVIVPCWGAAGLLLALPGVWILTRPKKYRAGMCPGCGYDLRASAGRCPECGRGMAGGDQAESG